MKNITIIQDIPTIHNNKIIKTLSLKYKVTEFYALFHDSSRYNHKKPINNTKSIEYGNRLNPRFIFNILVSKDTIILVGLMNINTKIIFLFSYLLNKKIIYWTDLPQPKVSIIGKIKRLITLHVLKISNFTIWSVGKITLDYLAKNGIDKTRIRNVPILVDCCGGLETKLKKNDDKILIFSGSRLIYEKGFDILIKSISKLPDHIRNKIIVIISGDGEEYHNLKNLILKYKLDRVIKLTGWLSENDFINYLKESDIVIQPSRYDAFGLSIYGMAYCSAVIASDKSGAAIERIIDNKNGFIYKFDDTNALRVIITHLVEDNFKRIEIAGNGYKTAKKWTPDYIFKVLRND